MSRVTAYARMLNASAKMQWDIAMILEAKAVEAEKVSSWLCSHPAPNAFTERQEHSIETANVNEQLIEMIDGLTRLNQGMASVLKTALRHDRDGGGTGGMRNLLKGGNYNTGD